jgi:hypothetical protein
VFINISEYFEFKLRALRAYDQEMRPYPHSRSYDHLTALARHRGSSVGVEFAESYHVCRLLF